MSSKENLSYQSIKGDNLTFDLVKSYGDMKKYHLNPYSYNDAKRRVYGKNLAKKQKCSVPCSVLFSSRYIDEKKIFRQRFVSGSG